MTISTSNPGEVSGKFSYLGLWLILIATGFSASCASVQPDNPSIDPISVALRARGVEPDQVLRPFVVTAEMRDWAQKVIRGGRDPESRLLQLQKALVDPNKMALRYQRSFTGTAVEAFRKKEVNCLSFAHLFVGLARAVGLPAHFVTVEKTGSYGGASNLRVVSDHIAVAHGNPWRRQIIDFNENPDDDARRFRQISDLTAIAMFYSNRGAELLQSGALAEAISWLEMAVRLDPDLSNAWVNLGVARRRSGDSAGAEKAYRRSLDSDPTVLSAYRNLESLLRLQGRLAEAEDMLAQRPRRTRGRASRPW